MAYAVLHSVAQTIDRILNHGEYSLSVEGKQQIASVLDDVIFLQEILDKFPRKAENWETRISDAANEAEDVIERFMYEDTRLRYKSIRSAAARRQVAVRPTNHLHDFHELKMVMKEFSAIARVTKRFRNVRLNDIPAMQSAPPPSPSSTSAPAVDGFTVGLDEDLEKIKDLVCGESSKRQIIPITGMGGIGKTTLAKRVYHDQLIMEEFAVRAWVTVSQDYKIENIFADLLYSLQNIVGEGTWRSSDSTEDKVYQILTVRKYLIVLDDLWSEKAWNDIKRAFPDTGKGSRLVITTRIESVASHVDSSSPLHKMRFLDPDQSWDLLERKVFSSIDCPSRLEAIGKDIATSCGGLPLAIVLVAGILSTMSETQSSWEELARKVHSSVDEEEGHFEKIISLSYTHLPHYLRPCLLYMGGLPEDYTIRVSKLIKLWIAEGFVKQEEEAEEYLKNLVKRSLALVTTIKSNGKIKSCSVHDLVRDLCKRKTLDENYERRMSVAHPDLTFLARAYASTLRSVISFQPNDSSLGGLRKFSLLRVLDVVDTDAYLLPAPIFELFHLRFLAFGCPMEIPPAISRLQNLRTLIIRPSKRLRHYSSDELYLPLEIWMMPLLTNLVSFFDLLPNPEEAASALENLLTLSVVKKLICTKEMMEKIPNVKKLGITYFGDKYQEDYQLHNLVLLHQLEKLTLVLRKGPLVGREVNPVFPETLRKLTLSGWRFPWTYMEVVGSLPSLQILKLRDFACEGEVWKTNPLQFPSLEFLHIDASNLKEWITENSHFPKLKRLVLYRCPSLSEIPEAIGEITALELIEVDYANESLAECVKQIQEEQKGYGNYSLQVRRVHYKVSFS
ncbi:putative late blight resistance protein homolog R1B-14 [Salvia miltiorrhiza]|uniref:putative late blight resistance protein homolog R1B-14 n=1 Tax=Salvia miltiorrhiza TaxID=226208 RepID=UPI0025ACFACD|nr:putative late blight resistance protein homolog R1B-14 [Salvia miltiorrhiza]